MNNSKCLIYIIILLFNFTLLKSNDTIPLKNFGNELWYVELMGNSFVLSFNYEYSIIKKFLFTDETNIRIGIGSAFPFDYLIIPVMLNFIYGKKHCFEIGAGLLFDYVYKEKGKSEYTYPQQTIKYISVIGYRYKNDGDIIIRAGLTPFYSSDVGIRLWTGISFGQYF